MPCSALCIADKYTSDSENNKSFNLLKVLLKFSEIASLKLLAGEDIVAALCIVGCRSAFGTVCLRIYHSRSIKGIVTAEQ